jgi:formylglycine-generating enzyme required for sulfatase activity
MDKWEASVWYVPPSTPALAQLVNWMRTGNVSGLKGPAGLAAAKSVAAGVVQLGLAPGDLVSHGCPETGNGCTNIYAASIPGVTPASFISWFQAAAAARNSFKRLPSNQEWQVAALGTPDGVPCAVSPPGPAPTGTVGCVSDVGAFDMVGNLWEWVADWMPRTSDSNCSGSWGAFSDNIQCLVGAAATGPPGALIRGGSVFDGGPLTGVFAVSGFNSPSTSGTNIGFRGTR